MTKATLVFLYASPYAAFLPLLKGGCAGGCSVSGISNKLPIGLPCSTKGRAYHLQGTPPALFTAPVLPVALCAHAGFTTASVLSHSERRRRFPSQDSREYQMLLIPSKMYEMDLEPPPVSNDPKEWQAWSRLLVPRLELTDDGLLQVI